MAMTYGPDVSTSALAALARTERTEVSINLAVDGDGSSPGAKEEERPSRLSLSRGRVRRSILVEDGRPSSHQARRDVGTVLHQPSARSPSRPNMIGSTRLYQAVT
jgi:hypothetical protein